jgi:transposase
VTLSRDAVGRYHVSFCAQVPKSLLPIKHRVVGVDMGLHHLATLSTGEKIPNPKRYYARLGLCATVTLPDGKVLQNLPACPRT